MRIIVNANLTERVQHSRSPSRAKRRARLGYPQHFTDRPATKAYKIGDTLVVHPAMYAAMKAEVNARALDRPLFASAGFMQTKNPFWQYPSY